MLKHRPRAIALIGVAFIAVGAVGVVRGTWGLVGGASVRELGVMILSGVVAALGGALLLLKRLWGRWLLAAWMALHVVLSFFHGPLELVVHVTLFSLVSYFLFWPERSRAPA
jgi:hypothetical protein